MFGDRKSYTGHGPCLYLRPSTNLRKISGVIFVASTKHPPSVAYYKRKREQGKHHNAAIICLARRRCDVIYSMLKNGTLYQEPALVA